MHRIPAVIVLFLFAFSGCGSSDRPADPGAAQPPAKSASSDKAVLPKDSATRSVSEAPVRTVTAAAAPRNEDAPHADAVEAFGAGFMNTDRLRDRLKVGRVEPQVEFVPDLAKLEAAGVRVLEGKHVQLFTDLPSSPQIDELPTVFDAAFRQWCEYFRVDPGKNADWRIKAVLMANREKFRELGLYPDTLPSFLHGYARGDAVWLLDQPSDYYRRHLLLHEGTHAFMQILLGGAGPDWYMEGTAEYFGTHRWDGTTLETRVVPESKEASPMWGRIKIIQDEVQEGRALSLQRVMLHGGKDFLQNKPYAWCWAIVAFLDNHSLSREKFREMVTQVKLTGGFSERLMGELGDVWPTLAENWQVFVTNAEYGYDWNRNEVEYREAVPWTGEVATAEIRANHGWQSTGIRLEPGVDYELTATGQYQINDDGEPWMCEPNGVTIHYWKKKPLGMLLGAIRSDQWAGQTITPLATPEGVGLKTTIHPEGPATLFLKVNENPGKLADNEGTIQVEIRRVTK